MTVKIYATSWCPDCRRTKQFLDAHGVAYTEVDIDTNPSAASDVVKHAGKRAIPQLVIDGEWFQPYTPGHGLRLDELSRRLGIVRG
jgi:mycoredoxin